MNEGEDTDSVQKTIHLLVAEIRAINEFKDFLKKIIVRLKESVNAVDLNNPGRKLRNQLNSIELISDLKGVINDFQAKEFDYLNLNQFLKQRLSYVQEFAVKCISGDPVILIHNLCFLHHYLLYLYRGDQNDLSSLVIMVKRILEKNESTLTKLLEVYGLIPFCGMTMKELLDSDDQISNQLVSKDQDRRAITFQDDRKLKIPKLIFILLNTSFGLSEPIWEEDAFY